MFFLQKGTPWNTIQFFYYSLFFLSILSGITIATAPGYAQIIIILLTIPTSFITLKQIYLTQKPPSYLSNEEYEALNFLSDEPYGNVLTYPFDESQSLNAPAPNHFIYMFQLPMSQLTPRNLFSWRMK
jgi:hypothetical protein